MVQLVSETSLEGKSQPRFTTGRWNPHHNCVQIATANDTYIRGWDLRTLQLATILLQHTLLIAFLSTCSVVCMESGTHVGPIYLMSVMYLYLSVLLLVGMLLEMQCNVLLNS